MEYIIDAYNVIKSSSLKTLSDDYARNEFMRLLINYKNRHFDVRFIAVFDGSPPGDMRYDKQERIRVLFSGSITADETIRRLLEQRGAERNSSAKVVSNDREVRACGRILGAGVQSVEDFMNRVAPVKAPAKKTKKPSTLDYFKASKIKKELENYYSSKEKHDHEKS